MNEISPAARASILQLLREGMSIRAIERTAGASKHTITNPLNDAGRLAVKFQTAPLPHSRNA